MEALRVVSPFPCSSWRTLMTFVSLFALLKKKLREIYYGFAFFLPS